MHEPHRVEEAGVKLAADTDAPKTKNKKKEKHPQQKNGTSNKQQRKTTTATLTTTTNNTSQWNSGTVTRHSSPPKSPIRDSLHARFSCESLDTTDRGGNGERSPGSRPGSRLRTPSPREGSSASCESLTVSVQSMQLYEALSKGAKEMMNVTGPGDGNEGYSSDKESFTGSRKTSSAIHKTRKVRGSASMIGPSTPRKTPHSHGCAATRVTNRPSFVGGLDMEEDSTDGERSDTKVATRETERKDKDPSNGHSPQQEMSKKKSKKKKKKKLKEKPAKVTRVKSAELPVSPVTSCESLDFACPTIEDLNTVKRKRRMSLRLEVRLKKTWFTGNERNFSDSPDSPLDSPGCESRPVLPIRRTTPRSEDERENSSPGLILTPDATSVNRTQKRQTWTSTLKPAPSPSRRKVPEVIVQQPTAKSGSMIVTPTELTESELLVINTQKKKRSGSMRAGMVPLDRSSLPVAPATSRVSTSKMVLSAEPMDFKKEKAAKRGSLKGGSVALPKGLLSTRIEEDPLLIACRQRDATALRAHLDEARGKKKTQIFLAQDRKGKTAFHICAELPNNVGMLSLLLNYAKEHLKKKQFSELLDMTDNDGWTALHCASSMGQLTSVQLLLKSGADATILTKSDSATCLHHLCAYKTYTDSSENEDKLKYILNTLEQKGLPLDHQTATNGETALHTASLAGNRVLVKVLLDIGIPIETLQTTGETALHYAARGDFPKIVKLLLQKSSSPNVVGQSGTPYEVAKSEKVRAILHRAVETPHASSPPTERRPAGVPTLHMGEEFTNSFLNLLARPLPPTPPGSGERFLTKRASPTTSSSSIGLVRGNALS
eukprot:TRINITY_DN5855_c0_g1_i1.p1 TRINITY_DN5855_c0_g1~~TRINITY_DN5855_c0_g1_i1.p1  ORF type:complete len:831 (+),score=112.17 TRINITY_DN5855_c0_g1_i1:189-2681(+)